MPPRKNPTPPPATPVLDVDALLAETPPDGDPVRLRFKGREWDFKPLSAAPMALFTDELNAVESAAQFLRTMLAPGQDMPADVTLRESQVLIDAYVKAATGESLGES